VTSFAAGSLSRLDQVGPARFALLLLLFGASAVWLVGGLATSWSWHPPGFVNEGGAAIGRDFVAPFAAGRMAIAHSGAGAYDFAQLAAAEQRSLGAPVPFVAWLYPPTFLLAAAPLALLPYLAALALWLLLQLAALALLLRRIAPPMLPAWLCIVAGFVFPGTAQSLISGQNGLLSAALIGGGLLTLEREPILAGVLFGALSYKPQVAAAAFAALLIGAHWRTLAAALSTALALAAASVLAFGFEPWAAFLQSLGTARMLLETGQLPLERMVTVFAAARLAGASAATSSLLQAIVSLAALAALAYVWRHRAPLVWRGSVLVTCIPLTTPYAFDYDLVMLLLPMAFILAAGLGTGFRRGERALLVVLWLSPVAVWLFARWSQLQLMPAILLLLLFACCRRCKTDPVAD
jgi:alpha-1,2-mannosyltransferase